MKKENKPKPWGKRILMITVIVIFAMFFYCYGYIAASQEWKNAYISEVQAENQMTYAYLNQLNYTVKYYDCEMRRIGIIKDNETELNKG